MDLAGEVVAGQRNTAVANEFFAEGQIDAGSRHPSVSVRHQPLGAQPIAKRELGAGAAIRSEQLAIGINMARRKLPEPPSSLTCSPD